MKAAQEHDVEAVVNEIEYMTTFRPTEVITMESTTELVMIAFVLNHIPYKYRPTCNQENNGNQS